MAAPQARSAERQRRILKAALECFCGLGFSATTLGHIRARSGASTGSIYHHFSGKEQIAGALYLEGLRDYQEGLVAEVRRQRRAAGGIRAIVRYHLRWVSRHPDWARYLLHMRRAESVAAVEGQIREINGRFLEEIRGWVEPFMARGDIGRLPEELLLAVALGPTQEFARLLLTGRARTGVAQAQEVLAEAAWKSLRGGRPRKKESRK